jgi:DNA-binding MarR family transcriptional regulator
MNLRALRTPIAPIIIVEQDASARRLHNDGQKELLRLIDKHQPANPSMLAKLMGCSPQYITKAARRLEARGLIVREFPNTRACRVLYRMAEGFVA